MTSEQENYTKISVRMKIAFFGTDDFSVKVLETLKKEGLLPTLIITTKDKPKGRKLVLTPCEVKIWAQENNVEYLEPEKLNAEFQELYKKYEIDLGVVASYGKIIPEAVLEIPKHKTINVHPSLLPKLRGASPLQSAILEENETGVTIIKLDKEMDHGPILAQQKLDIKWPPYIYELKEMTAKLGGEMTLKVIKDINENKLNEVEQNHNEATFTKKIEKKMAEINLNDAPDINLRKIRALQDYNPFFYDNEKRIIIKKAHIKDNELVIEKVVPEGKKEMDYSDYLRGKK